MSNLVKLSKGGSVLLAILFSISTASASQVYDNNTGTYTDDFSDNVGIPTRTKVNVNSGIIQLQNATNTTFNTPYSATGEVLTSAVIPTSVAKWGTVTVNANVPASTTVRMQVYGSDMAYLETVLPGNLVGFDISSNSNTVNISSIPPLINLVNQDQPLVLGIKLLFTTSDPLYTPTVDSLVVTWTPKQGDLASTTLAISDWPKSFANIANTLHIPSSNSQIYPSFEWGSEKITGCQRSTPGSIFNGELIESTGGCSDRSSFITGLDINSGVFNWKLPSIGFYDSFTIGSNGTAYNTEYGYDEFVAIDLINHNIKWTYNWPGGHGGNSVDIGEDGMIYTIRHNPIQTMDLLAFNPDGTLAYTENILDVTPKVVFASEFAKDPQGILYFNTYIGDNTGNINLGKTYAFNPKTRSIIWQYPTGDSYAPPVIGPDGTIYIANWGGYGSNPFSKKIYALNSDGTLKWQKDYSSTTDQGYYTPLSLRSDGVLLATLQTSFGNNTYNDVPNDASSTLQAIDSGTGNLLYQKPLIGSNVGFTDDLDNLYMSSAERGVTGGDWYSVLGYYNKTLDSKWKIKYAFNDESAMVDRNFTAGAKSLSSLVGDSRGWLYGSFTKTTQIYPQNTEDLFTQYFALSPWTLSVNINADTVSPGSQLSFSALSSMKQVNPLFGGNNAMQVVLDTGEKIPLLYNGLDGRGSTVWTASYTIPTDYKLGDHSYTLEASQTYLVTDIPTHFAATTTESNNTGITRTGTFKVQQAGILFTSTGGTGNTTVQNTAEVLFVTGTSTATTTPTVVTNTNPTPTVPTSSPYSIQEPLTRTLRYRTWGTDVEHLQTILAKDPNIYPEGLVTGYFGTLTRSAVQAVQNRWNIVTSSDAGYGIFGPKTLAKVREQWGW